MWSFIISGAHINIRWNDLIPLWSLWLLLDPSLSFTKKLVLWVISTLGNSGISRTPSEDAYLRHRAISCAAQEMWETLDFCCFLALAQ